MHIQKLEEQLQRYLNYLTQDEKNESLQISIGILEANIKQFQQNFDAAITILENLNRKHANQPKIIGLLAILHFDNNNPDQAKYWADIALALNPNNYDGLLVHLLLKALAKQITISEINTLLALNPTDSRLLFILGTTEVQNMNLPAAESSFTQISQLWPTFYDNWIALGSCYLLQNKLDNASHAYQQATIYEPTIADGWGGLALIAAIQKLPTEAKKYLKEANKLKQACTLADLANMILSSTTKPSQSATYFNSIFPEITQVLHKTFNKTKISHNGTETLH